MISIGETLRRERIARNLDLEQISRELKISHRFLKAIEEEQFDRLPGTVFAKSFVRQYARLLGLDEEELANEVKHTLEPASTAPQFTEMPKPMPVAEIRLPKVEAWETVSGGNRFSWSSSLPALAGFVLVMLVCSIVYSFWQQQRHKAATPPPAPVAQLTPPVAQQPAAPPAEATPAPPAPTPETHPPDTAAAGASAAKPATTDPVPAKPATPADTPNPNAPVRLQVTADEEVWVRVQKDGKYLFSGTLTPNQTRTVDADENVVLRLGNAGNVSFVLNGKPVGPVGPKGQVRTVQFTSGGFQIVPGVKPSLPDDPL